MSRYLKPANAALVISVLALIGAVVVPAVAQMATTSVSKKERQLIRKIARLQANKLISKKAPRIARRQANKRITARAPSLNVNSALSAVNSQNAANADKVDGLDAGCPSGTVLVAGTCFETERRAGPEDVFEALEDCADEGRYIATFAQLAALDAVIDLGGGQYEYTSNIYVNGATFMVIGINGSVIISGNDTDASIPYRCATGPVG